MIETVERMTRSTVVDVLICGLKHTTRHDSEGAKLALVRHTELKCLEYFTRWHTHTHPAIKMLVHVAISVKTDRMKTSMRVGNEMRRDWTETWNGRDWDKEGKREIS